MGRTISNFAVDNEFETPYDYHEAVYNTVLDNIDVAEEEGELSGEEADLYRLEAGRELNFRILVEDGYGEEDAYVMVYGEEEDNYAEEDIEYSLDEALATFSEEPANGFAQAIIELIDAEYDDPEDAIAALSEATGYEPEDIFGLLSGEYVPDENLVDDISGCFGSTSEDEDMYVALQLLGAEARGEEFDEEYDEEDYDYETPVVDEAAYSRLNELENQIASFHAERAVANDLSAMIDQAQELVATSRLYPVEFNALFGTLPDDRDEDKIAKFATVCQQNGVDVDTELYAMRKCLELASRRGEILPSGQIVSDEFSAYDEETAQFNADVEDQAARNLKLYKQQGHLAIK